MDFSLSRAPADQLHVGTRPYLDPFLDPQFGRTRWDLAGDRFAAAMVLHEMAAGTLPYWGSRNTDPRFTDAEVTVDRDAFPREIAAPLAELLERALRRDATRALRHRRRHGARVEADLRERSTSRPRTPKAQLDAVHAALEGHRDTPVVALGLSARAVNALDRESVLTVADFLALLAAGDQLDARRRASRRAASSSTPSATCATASGARATDDDHDHDRRARRRSTRCAGRAAHSARTTRNATEVDAISSLLGLSSCRRPARGRARRKSPRRSASPGPRSARSSRRHASAGASSPRSPSFATKLIAHLEALGGIASGGRARARRARRTTGRGHRPRRGPRARRGPRGRRGRARAGRRRVWRSAAQAAAASSSRSAGEDGAERQRVLDHALRLGAVADEIAGGRDARAPERGRRAPGQADATGRARRPLGRAPRHARRCGFDIRGRLRTPELHPRDMSAGRALALGRAALLGSDAITPAEIRRRIAARFPHAQPLPDRPALDTLLRDGELRLPVGRRPRQLHRPLTRGADRRSRATSPRSRGWRPRTSRRSLGPRPIPQVVEARGV